jgi:4-hydroxy-tetrahydrodipicolinate reductase
VRIALHGYGRMGKAVEEVALQRKHQIAARFDEDNPLPEQLEGVDAIIDFSHAAAVGHLFDVACRSSVPLVSGTTGWDDQKEAIAARVDSAGIAAIFASNFSIGANIVFALARQAGELFGSQAQYAAGIEERHHDQKKDAPSGTALRIAAAVREGSSGVIDPAIVASRVGKEFGLHTLFFDSEDDLIEISHRARGRNGFARGAVVAAEMLPDARGLVEFGELLSGTLRKQS